MDDLVATAETEQCFDLARLAPAQPLYVGCRVGTQPARDLRAGAVAHDDRIAALELAVDGRDSGREQALAAQECGGRTGIDAQLARRLQRAGDPLLAHRGWACARVEPGAARTRFDPRERVQLVAESDTHVATRTDGDARGRDLRRHAAGPDCRTRSPGHRLDLGRDRPDFRNEPGLAIACGIGRVQPVHVRQQHQAIGTDHLRDACGQPIVIPVADLCGGHGVVLIDDWQGSELQQRAERAARVEVAASLFGVRQREQDLRHADRMLLEDFLPGVCKPDLPDSSGCLAFLQLQPPGREAEMPPAESDRARGHEQDLLAAGAQSGDVRGKGFHPRAIQPSAYCIHQQCRADFDDDAAGTRQRSGGRLTFA
jgi:hypothetical protein